MAFNTKLALFMCKYNKFCAQYSVSDVHFEMKTKVASGLRLQGSIDRLDVEGEKKPNDNDIPIFMAPD